MSLWSDSLTWLASSFAGAPAWAWLLFLGIMVALLAVDLGVLHREEREISIQESLWTSGFYIVAACAFAGWVWTSFGEHAGMRFLTGYVIEKALSLDNIFVISLIFATLAYRARSSTGCCSGAFSACFSCAPS